MFFRGAGWGWGVAGWGAAAGLALYWGGQFSARQSVGGGVERVALTVPVLTAADAARALSVTIDWRGQAEGGVVRAVLGDMLLRQAARLPAADLAGAHPAALPGIRAALQARLNDTGAKNLDLHWTLQPVAENPAAAQIAAARADAATLLQQTDSRRAAIFARAHAAAAERVAFARSVTATVTALQGRMDASSRAAILADLYRDRIADILRKAGSVSTVDPKSVSRLILPDPAP